MGCRADLLGGLRIRCLLIKWGCVLFGFALAAQGLAVELNEQDKEPSVAELKELTLEEMVEIKVTSVARSPEPMKQAPAAITVITGDDIRRSGATTIPDALRLAPGVEVAREGSFWDITVRGFNDTFANKLLVLMDGRLIYTPLFSGVFWGIQDTMLEDIDRIEVIRGPGGTLWGANAVNGVINIYTKSAKETQGLLITGGGGSEEIGFAGIRYGTQFKDGAYLRVYGKYFNRDDSKQPSGEDAADRWQFARSGFRLDWQPADTSLFTFQGDIYDGFQDQRVFVPTTTPPFAATRFGVDSRGGNLISRWTRTYSEDSELILQAYYDKVERESPDVSSAIHIGDIDFQHRFPLGERHAITWGAGYRLVHDDTDGSLAVAFDPASETKHLFSSFVQDEITIVPDKWGLTLGSKFEHNDFTGFEVQPSVRLLWTPGERHAVWAAISRAVRTPSRAEDAVISHPAGVPPNTFTLRGQRAFDSEELLAYELGYRVQIHERVALDLATFYNDYDNLASVEPVTPSEFVFANGLSAQNYGVELAPAFQATKSWRITGGYTFLESHIHSGPRSIPLFAQQVEGNSPVHQFFIRSAVDFGESVQWDAILRYVDTLTGLNVPSYFSLDTRIAWRWGRHTEIAIVGQNLLDSQHLEFQPAPVGARSFPIEIERGVYGKITWRF